MKRPDDILWFGRAPNRDTFQRLPGVEFEEALSRAARACEGELAVSVISMEDLIANKRAVARDQDFRDERSRERELISNPAADSILLLGDDAATTASIGSPNSTGQRCAYPAPATMVRGRSLSGPSSSCLRAGFS